MPDDRSSDGSDEDRAVTTGLPAQAASSRVQFRRAMALLLMTLVVPGSAQLVGGNRRLGRVCIRIWLGCLAVGLVLVGLSLTSRTAVFDLATDQRLLIGARWLLTAGAVAWVVLLLDAWRLGMPRRLARRQRLVTTCTNGFLCLAITATMLFAADVLAAQNHLIGSVFAAENVSHSTDGRYNVLLLGGDAGSDREGMRPDSLSVASIDQDTGRTVVIGLPRNLQKIPFPEGSVMDREFPDGFDCDDCYLNAVNTWADDHADLFDSDDPGLQATTEAVEEITGLDIHYYAMVDMEGFSQLIDAVGGVTIDVKERTAIGGIGAPITGWIDAGEQKLNGFEALWYSRSRVQNNDFSRMGRQKCVMNAMLNQLSPQKVLLNVQKIAQSGEATLQTNIPAGELGTFLDLALKARTEPVSTVSLVPPAIETGDPDYPRVRQMIQDALAAAEGEELTPVSALEAVTPAVPPPPQTEDEAAADTTVANDAADLDESC